MESPRSWLLALALLAPPVVPGLAAQSPAPAPAREWRVSPYLIFPHMNGTTGVGPVDAEVDASPSDVFENLQFGAMLVVELRSGEWAVAFDGIYMDLGKDGERLPSEVSVYQAALELAVFRRVAPWAEVVAGGRVNLMGGSAVGPLGQEFETDKSWFDPFVGTRLTAAGGERWTFVLRGDIGGFGVGSDLAWQVHPTAEYRLSRTVSLTGGYRVIGVDYEEGSGAERFAYDVRTFGPELGVVLHF
jgi:hypothetical protein